MKLRNLTTAVLLGSAVLLSSCRTPLYRAAASGDVSAVQTALANGEEVDGKASAANLLWQVPCFPFTLVNDTLHVGLLIGTAGRYMLLTDAMGIKSPIITDDLWNFRSKTPMEVAYENKDWDVITELVIAGASAHGWTKAKVLSEAARNGNADKLKGLLQSGIGAEQYCHGDYSPLMLAVGNGHEECAKLLISHGARFTDVVNDKDGNRIYFDTYAIQKGRRALYEKLGGVVAQSPASVVGKYFIFDYSDAEYREETFNNNNESAWSKWKKCNGSTSDPTLKFGKGNKVVKIARFGDDGFEQTYTKTGERTATVNINEHEYYRSFKLTFETPTSGYAFRTVGIDGLSEEYRGVKFTLK